MSTDNLPAAPVAAPPAPAPAAGLPALGTTVVPPRLPELGAIRFGHQVTNDKGKTYPVSLEKPRLTSSDRTVLENAAKVPSIGGEVKDWANQATGEAGYELYTEATSLDVMLPLGMGVTICDQVFERYARGFRVGWSDGYMVHEVNQKHAWVDRPVDGDELEGKDWSRVTRLRLMLADVPGAGVWTLNTSSAYAAHELPAVIAYLAQMTVGAAEPVSARLTTTGKTQRKIGPEGPETKKFRYPVLIIDETTPRQMLEQRQRQVAALEAGAQQADPRALMQPPTVTREPVTIFPNDRIGEITDPGPGDPADGKARRALVVELVKRHAIPHADLKAALADEGLDGASAASFADLEQGDQRFRSAVMAIGKAAAVVVSPGASDRADEDDDDPETVDGEAEEIPAEDPNDDPDLPPELPGAGDSPRAYSDPE